MPCRAGQTACRGGYHPPAPWRPGLRQAPTRRAPPFLPKEMGGKKGPGGVPPGAPPVRGFMAAVGGTNRAEARRASPPVFLAVSSQALPRLGWPASTTRQALIIAALYQPGPPGRRRCHASEILGWSRWRANGASGMPRPTSSAQATDRSLPRKRESSFPPLGLPWDARRAGAPREGVPRRENVEPLIRPSVCTGAPSPHRGEGVGRMISAPAGLPVRDAGPRGCGREGRPRPGRCTVGTGARRPIPPSAPAPGAGGAAAPAGQRAPRR